MSLYDLLCKYYQGRRGWRVVLNIIPFRFHFLLRDIARCVAQTPEEVEIAMMVVTIIAKQEKSKEATDQQIFARYEGTFAAFLLVCSSAYWRIPLTRHG